jgi:2-polyprenyl-3-methyl-5-hydroxy-6-metoxy-1,4-benzoquinol methylase
MGRLILLAIFIISIIAIVFLLRILWEKLTRTFSRVVKKSSNIVLQQQQKWQQREKRKKLPAEIQRLIVQYEALLETNNKLSAPWQAAMTPVYSTLGDIVHILTAAPKKIRKVRTLFSVSLPAVEKFLVTISSDQKFMDELETKKAQQNIAVIFNDLQQHERLLQKSRRFDFDVIMEVIKIRLKRN